MSTCFNLLDEPWIPVRLSSGTVEDVGLLALFERLGEIAALAETSPPTLVAMHRLLLAVTHRVDRLEAFDRVLELDAGRIVWEGSGLEWSARRAAAAPDRSGR